MSFFSIAFAGFVCLTLLLFQSLPKGRRWLLLIASLLFYLSWGRWALALHLVCASFTFFAALAMERWPNPRAKKFFLRLAILFFGGAFLFFKARVHILNSDVGFGSFFLNLAVPIGLSYYSFQCLGYLIDVYWERARAARKYSDFLLFTAFFPHALTGPIARFGQLMPQLERLSELRSQWAEASFLLAQGAFKKLVISERLQVLANFEKKPVLDFHGLPLVAYLVLSFFQMYCDFSGYTDLARGLAKLFGLDLIENFYRPYLARSPADVWMRWHYSLVSWVRDYVYWPLALRFKNPALAITVAMFLVGFWHRVSIRYFDWALYWSVVYWAYIWLRARKCLFAFPHAVQIFLTLLIASASTILLELSSPHDIVSAFAALPSLNSSDFSLLLQLLGAKSTCVILCGLGLMFASEKMQHAETPLNGRSAAVWALVFSFLTIAFGEFANPAFIYMRF